MKNRKIIWSNVRQLLWRIEAEAWALKERVERETLTDAALAEAFLPLYRLIATTWNARYQPMCVIEAHPERFAYWPRKWRWQGDFWRLWPTKGAARAIVPLRESGTLDTEWLSLHLREVSGSARVRAIEFEEAFKEKTYRASLAGDVLRHSCWLYRHPELWPGKFAVEVEHLFHHLNAAWNARHKDDPKDDLYFYRNEKFPTEAPFRSFWKQLRHRF